MDEIIDFIWQAACDFWDLIKKFIVKVLKFFAQIANWFRDSSRLRKLQKNKNLIAASIKKELEDGNYNIVNCLFDKVTNEVVSVEEDMCVVDAEGLDEETKKHFGNKHLLVLS